MSIYRMATLDVPSYEETTSDSYTKLLLHCDGTNGSTTFTDKIGKTITAVGNAQISTAQSKFRGASGKFDGTGDYLTTPDSEDFNFGSGDVTIDLWARWSVLGNAPFFQQSNGTGGYILKWAVYYDYANTSLKWGGHNPAATPVTWISKSFTPSIDTWYHIAFVKSGTTFNIFVNGTSLGTVTSSVAIPNVTSLLYSGFFYDMPTSGETYYNGYLDEVRISKGIARWTSNFTPPTAPYDTTITPTGTNVNVPIVSQYRGLSGVNRQIKTQYRGYSGVNRLVFGSNKTYLYNRGEQCTALTGGWVEGGNTNQYHLTLTYTPYLGFGNVQQIIGRSDIVSNNLIDLTNFTRLKAIVSGVDGGTIRQALLRVSSIKISTWDTVESRVASLEASFPIAEQEISIDISSINGSYYISPEGVIQNSTIGRVYFNEIWLE